jgi:hypothetical protein
MCCLGGGCITISRFGILQWDFYFLVLFFSFLGVCIRNVIRTLRYCRVLGVIGIF